MTRQNLTLAFLVLFVVAVLGGLLWSSGFLDSTPLQQSQTPTEASPNEIESMGDPVDPSLAPIQGELGFRGDLLASCLQINLVDLPTGEPTGEAFIEWLSKSWDQPIRNQDRWVSWNLKTRDGKEKRIRLEVREDEAGQLKRELRVQWVDRDGLPLQADAEENRKLAPSDEVIHELLREGDVTYKERAALVTFSRNRSFSFVEVDNVLTEVRMQSGDLQFACQNMKVSETCRCSNDPTQGEESP